jgi:glycosyltransferase involved in cell wall biosynthesis
MRFSIVTPVLNRASTIRDCIESVARQIGDVEAVQHIVVDGGSDDGTLEILAEYPHLEVIHEPVRGIYVAMNRGLAAARHDIVAIVNSDDILESKALATVSQIFADHPDRDVIAGRAVVERVQAGSRAVVRSVPARSHLSQSWDLYFHGSLGINARFFRRRVFDSHGMFNTDYAICADRELLIRMKLAGIATLPVDRVVYRYLEHEESATLNAGRRYDLRMREEHIAIAQGCLAGGRLSAALSRQFRGWIAAERARNMLSLLRDRSWRAAWKEARLGSEASVSGFTTFLLRRAVAVPIAALVSRPPVSPCNGPIEDRTD